MATRKKIVKKAVKPVVKQSEHAQIIGFVILTILQLFTAALVAVAAVTAVMIPFNNGDILMATTLIGLAFVACILVQVCYDL